MRRPWGRARAMLGLLAAIFSDLGRRAWWAYRRGGLHMYQPHVTVVARRPGERHTYVPMVTDVWRPVVAQALPVRAVAAAVEEPDDAIPIVWIDVRDRPDIADLPRVLQSERAIGDDVPLVGTQWLADPDAQRTMLLVTYAEPVACTWAISFDVPRRLGTLERIAAAGELFVAWNEPPSEGDDEEGGPALTELPAAGLLLPAGRPAQLEAILTMWAEQLAGQY